MPFFKSKKDKPMKTLMKKIDGDGRGCKKARFWNMAQFQPRRWHREQDTLAQTSATTPLPESTESSPRPDLQPSRSLSTITPAVEPRPEPPLANGPSVPAFAPPCEPAEPQPCASSPVPSLPLLGESRIRTGKIARLPEQIRAEVNHLLRHATSYADISKRLADLGYPGVSINNIYNWRHGGFVDWYRDMQAREAALIPLKALERCSRAIDIDRWQQNAVLMAAEKFTHIMAGINHQRAIEAVYEKPELLPKYIASMRDLSRCAADLAKAYAVTQQQES